MKNHMSKSRTIGMLLQQSSGSIFTNPFYITLIQSVDKACQQHSYGFLLLVAHVQQDIPAFFSCASAHIPIDGLILTSPKVKESLDIKLPQQNLPIVLLNDARYKHASERGNGAGYPLTDQSAQQIGSFSVTTLLEKMRKHPHKIILETNFDQTNLQTIANS